MKYYQPGRVTAFTSKKMTPLLTNPIDQPCSYPWQDQHLSMVNQLLDELNQELNTELEAHVDALNWPGLADWMTSQDHRSTLSPASSSSRKSRLSSLI